MNLIPKDIPLSSILLDPNNYRFQDTSDYRPIPIDKYHLETNQQKSFNNLKSDIQDLVNSIRSNGYLQVERVVVAPYGEDGRYYVIEGNRRISALRLIKEEIDEGLLDDPDLQAIIAAVPCLATTDTDADPGFREALMGIRHVGGIKQWGGFQRAQLIYDLKIKFGLDSQTIAERLGLSTQEVNRRFRAMNALRQGLDDEDFGDKIKPDMYALFHEAVSVPIIRNWLGWSDTTNTFDSTTEREQFYELLLPRSSEELGKERPPKLQTYSDVRQLRDILPNAQAKASLLNIDEAYSTAIAAANQEQVKSKWREEVKRASQAVENISALDLISMTEEDLHLLRSLDENLRNMLETKQKISR